MTPPCPVCGQHLPKARVPAAARAILAPKEAAVFDFVYRHPGVTKAEIIDGVYADDPDGGPLAAYETVTAYISRANKKLIPYRLRIRASAAGGPGVTYIIVEEPTA
jgi:hypothetical protein